MRALVLLAFVGCGGDATRAAARPVPVNVEHVEPAVAAVTTVTSEPIPLESLSPTLRNATLRSPMPGGSLGGWYGDTGVDISGRFLPVYAIASGVLEYSERGHTLWMGKGDTPLSIRLRLDTPIPLGAHRVTHVYYTHLSAVVTEQPESSVVKKHVASGERIATSGIGNGVPHLHLGLLLDDEVEQDRWDFILREDAVRKVMGGYRNGEVLPLTPQSRAP
jgi:murein DD-endopeptidase MepM/ murein hydrolase activator NlpD